MHMLFFIEQKNYVKGSTILHFWCLYLFWVQQMFIEHVSCVMYYTTGWYLFLWTRRNWSWEFGKKKQDCPHVSDLCGSESFQRNTECTWRHGPLLQAKRLLRTHWHLPPSVMFGYLGEELKSGRSSICLGNFADKFLSWKCTLLNSLIQKK